MEVTPMVGVAISPPDRTDTPIPREAPSDPAVPFTNTSVVALMDDPLPETFTP
jgi:hypothetical protein